MKKFLSLVLAMIMALSLVTISAGATEYKDLTDKDEIEYEEAVAVLNRIGIITGYDDGSFRPETELTRGAAAKIIVSLMIGPEAASALPNSTSPYPDVPAGHTFAGVISYCKTAGYISGYGDGTFKPSNSLTGFAFAKMLLGAVGYKSDIEGFTGTGWTMNVARIGNSSGLFNRLSFDGAAAVNREQACQLALNTLKATMVEYTGGLTVSAGDAVVSANPTCSYVTSNQQYARNIDNRKAAKAANSTEDVYTVEFGEEHFKDLRLLDEHESTVDAFGRPSNEWSFKKVTIGTFPIAADYIFTEQTEHKDKTDAAKNRATGLSGLTLKNDDDEYTEFYINGKKVELNGAYWDTNDFGSDKNGEKAKVADISDMTDNGAVVEVYVDEDSADWISHVVVIKTQLMEIRKVGSDYVALQAYDNGTPDNKAEGKVDGFNQIALNTPVNNVQEDDALYATLKDMKAGDLVAVVPVATDHDGSDYDVADAYKPEEVKGAITAADTYRTRVEDGTSIPDNTVAVTVGGTKYNVAQWSKDLCNIDGDAVKVTKKDVTLYLDKAGNAMLAKDVGSTSDFIIIGSFTRTMSDGRIVTIANGWDISGEKLELNLGTATNVERNWNPGDVAYYTNSTKNHADWALSREGGEADGDKAEKTGGNKYVVGEVVRDENYEIKSSNVQVKVGNYGDDYTWLGDFLYTDKSVKFVFVNFSSDGEVDSVEVKKGVQNVKANEIAQDGNGVSSHGAQVAVKEDTVKAVIVKGESNDATAGNLMYIRERVGGYEKDADGNMIYKYTVVMMKPDEKVDEEVTIYSDDNVKADTFVAYTAKEKDGYDNFYDLRDHSSMVNRTTGTYQAELAEIIGKNKALLRLGNYKKTLGGGKLTGNEGKYIDGVAVPEVQKNTTGGVAPVNIEGGVKDIVRITNAEIVDLRYNAKTAKSGDREITSIDDLKWYFDEAPMNIRLDKDGDKNLGGADDETIQMQLVVNDNPNNDNFRDVALIVITAIYDSDTTDAANLGEAVSNDAGVDLEVFETATKVAAAKDGEDIVLDKANLSGNDVTSINKITLTPATGATIKKVVAPDFTWSKNPDLETLSVTGSQIADGETMTVTVAAADGSEETYVFTFRVVNSSEWQNDFVLDLMAEGGVSTGSNGFTDTDWKALDDTDVKVNADGKTIVAPVLVTGNDDDVLEQLKSAMDFIGINYDVNTIVRDDRDGTWYIPEKLSDNVTKTYEFPEPTTGLIYVKADPDSEAEPYIATIGTDTIDNVLTVVGTAADGDEVAVKTDDVEVGHTYTNKAWTEVTIAADQTVAEADVLTQTSADAGEGKYWITYSVPSTVKKDGMKVYLAAGEKITVTVNLKDAADIKTSSGDTVTVAVDDCTVTPATHVFKSTDTGAALAATFEIEGPAVAAAGGTVTVTSEKGA